MHHHGHDHHSHTKQTNNRKGLLIALGVTTVIMFLEFFGGLVTNSLALLSDSGHMLSDVGSLFFSLLAMWAAAKPATDSKQFGYHRFEILAALFNGLTLLTIAILILIEAYERLLTPQPVGSNMMIVIAITGLLANLVSAWALLRQGDVKDNINIRSAYLHIIGDALGSVGAIAAGLLMYFYSWYLADPIISAVVAVMILKGAYGVIMQSLHILMEGKPHGIDTGTVKDSLRDIEGVVDIHDLRIWTITSGLHSCCCHVLVKEAADQQTVLEKAVSVIKTRFGVDYVAIQVEKGCCVKNGNLGLAGNS